MSLFFTGKGDAGESLVGNNKIDKTGVEVEALGDVDELNSLIGLVRNSDIPEDFKTILRDVQEALFIVQAHLAEFMTDYVYKAPALSKARIMGMEDFINKFESEVNPRREFVVSGSNLGSAWLDYTRAVARRAERNVLRFSKARKLAPEVLAYMNRLSSLLFAMARVWSHRSDLKEDNPKYK